MKRIVFLLSLLVSASLHAAESKPNIIFILADDLGYGDLGCYGQQRIKTPNLDRMAEEGMRFTSVYSGATVCAPSRSVLMTGKHTGNTRVRGNAGQNEPARQALRDEDVTVAEVLKDSGYYTGLIGKWGLGDVGGAESGLPRKQGFDEFYGYLNQRHAHNYYPTFLWRNETREKLRNTVPDETPEGAGKSDNKLDYTHDLFAEEALKFIKTHGENQKQPFFLYLALTTPHANNEAKQEGMEVPDFGDYAKEDWPDAQKGFAAMVSRLDRDVGRVLDRLKELGIDKNTLVIFSSDNGPHKEGGHIPAYFNSAGEFRGIKRDHTDGGIRVPTIAWWPGKVPGGKVSDAVWYFADALPTFGALASGKIPDGLDGLDVTPTLMGEAQPELAERFLYWEFHERGFVQASRWKNWKAIRPEPNAALTLYDLSKDVKEEVNVASENPEVVEAFESYLKTARTETADWPITAPKRGNKKN
ncbi:arylsulfatase [Phragmitibacter flavus]|uniref:Arylsulfatase n=1 Tax=Phragmitibacter flavus TaxID=2576071 RepID=A0A5R8KDR5_9BACT|nr:arylsulfatase [Phragmitibacter flavus]TLD70397.1 arylsulfatase [Phragmitibacter flavus]